MRKPSISASEPGDAPESDLPERTAAVYPENYRIVVALAGSYGFEYAFFWQPAIEASRKTLTEDERHIIEGERYQRHAPFIDKVYRHIRRTALGSVHLN